MHEHKFNPKQIGPFFYDLQKNYTEYTVHNLYIRTDTHTHTLSTQVYCVYMELDKRDRKKMRAGTK